MRSRLTDVLRSLPLAHQVTLGVAVAVLAMASFLFIRWVSTPSYAMLYGDLDDAALAQVVAELDRQGIDYRIDGGGSRVLVPQADVHEVRAGLATAGVQGGLAPQGYELLDDEGLGVSDFRQQIDYKRALEGELARTLQAMDEITAAAVHLVLPEPALFAEDEEPVTASVLLDTARPLSTLAVESVTFLVASSVEGLTPDNVTVADVTGQTLHAAGQEASSAGIGNRNLRLTRDYEASLAADVQALLAAAVGSQGASVVVRARLDFDEVSTEQERYGADEAITLKEQVVDESFDGTGLPPGGTLGVDGGPEPQAGDDYSYTRSEATREYGVPREVVRTVTAPGTITGLSVAVVLDDGSLTGAPAPPVAEVERLITAALGLDPERGDTVAVSAVAFPAPEEEVAPDVAEAAAGSPLDMVPQFGGIAVVVVVMLALLWMSRSGSRRQRKEEKRRRKAELAALPPPAAGEPAVLDPAAGLPAAGEGAGLPGPGDMRPEVVDLVQRQPEEIAVLLRSWLGDRR